MESFLQKSLQYISDDVLKELKSTLSPRFADKTDWDILYQAMNWGALGDGKRLRPFLLVNFANLFAIPYELSLKIAISLELMHCYSLIHDDLPAMDDASLRRSKPTVHKQYGEAMAILAGDALLTKSFEVLSSIEHEALACKEQLMLVNRLSALGGDYGLIAGQAFDMQSKYDINEKVDIEKLKLLQNLKTGAMFEFAVTAGAIVAKQEKQTLDKLKEFSYHFGLLYQITDDILDANSDEKNTGKDANLDVKNNKLTFVSSCDLKTAEEQAYLHLELAQKSLFCFNDGGSSFRNIEELLYYLVKRKS